MTGQSGILATKISTLCTKLITLICSHIDGRKNVRGLIEIKILSQDN